MMPLHLASWCNHFEIVKLIIERVNKSHINIIAAGSGNSALHYAA